MICEINSVIWSTYDLNFKYDESIYPIFFLFVSKQALLLYNVGILNSNDRILKKSLWFTIISSRLLAIPL